jgi:hypothetical protein
MLTSLKLNIDQVSAAIMLLNDDEKKQLRWRLPKLLGIDLTKLEDSVWLHLAEPAFEFWSNPAEDIYDDLVPVDSTEP